MITQKPTPDIFGLKVEITDTLLLPLCPVKKRDHVNLPEAVVENRDSAQQSS